jgi:hypothetical protein
MTTTEFLSVAYAATASTCKSAYINKRRHSTGDGWLRTGACLSCEWPGTITDSNGEILGGTTPYYDSESTTTTAAAFARLWCHDKNVIVYDPAPDPKQRLSKIISDRQAPLIISSPKHREPVGHPTDIREWRARQTLRELIGDDAYCRFLHTGIVSVRGESGMVYNIRPGYSMVEVFKGGQLTDRICIQSKGSYPPTDTLIMRCLLIWDDEKALWKIGVKHGTHGRCPVSPQPQPDLRPLPLIAADLKQRLGVSSLLGTGLAVA